jgi:hypothetical protein
LTISDDVGDMGLGMHEHEALTEEFRELAVVECDRPQMRRRSGIGRFGVRNATRSRMINRLDKVTSGKAFFPSVGGNDWC